MYTCVCLLSIYLSVGAFITKWHDYTRAAFCPRVSPPH